MINLNEEQKLQQSKLINIFGQHAKQAIIIFVINTILRVQEEDTFFISITLYLTIIMFAFNSIAAVFLLCFRREFPKLEYFLIYTMNIFIFLTLLVYSLNYFIQKKEHNHLLQLYIKTYIMILLGKEIEILVVKIFPLELANRSVNCFTSCITAMMILFHNDSYECQSKYSMILLSLLLTNALTAIFNIIFTLILFNQNRTQREVRNFAKQLFPLLISLVLIVLFLVHISQYVLIIIKTQSLDQQQCPCLSYIFDFFKYAPINFVSFLFVLYQEVQFFKNNMKYQQMLEKNDQHHSLCMMQCYVKIVQQYKIKKLIQFAIQLKVSVQLLIQWKQVKVILKHLILERKNHIYSVKNMASNQRRWEQVNLEPLSITQECCILGQMFKIQTLLELCQKRRNARTVMKIRRGEANQQMTASSVRRNLKYQKIYRKQITLWNREVLQQYIEIINMSNLNISGFLNSSARSNHALDKFLSAISNNDPDQSYLEMQSYLEEMKQSKQKDPIDEIEMFFTPHKCPKIAEVEKDLENTIQQINELQICDQATYQASLIKIKSVKKVITQIVDKYFLNLKNQYNFIANELVQISLAPIKKLIYQLRTDLSNYDEDQLNEIVVRQNQIREEISNFKMQLPKDIKLQISNQSISDIKTSLFKLISIAFKGNLILYLDPFSIIPANFKGFQLQKKNQVQLKSKKGQMKLQEQSDSTYSYRNNTLYYSQADTIAEVQMINCPINNDPNQKLSLCNIINTADSLYFLGFLYEDTLSKQKLLNNKLTRIKKQDNSLLDLTEMPVSTYGGQVIKFENNIYYWGGHILSDDQYINSKKGFKYSIRENIWEQIESMKYPRINGQCCVSDSKIYITGGMMNQFQGNPLIEIFDATVLKFNEPIELVNQLSYIPQILGYSFPISQQEILIIGGYNQYGNDENAQLINLFLKTVQRNQTKLPRILSLNCSQPMICQQQIHLFNSEQQKIELLSITTDTFQIQKIIPLQ